MSGIQDISSVYVINIHSLLIKYVVTYGIVVDTSNILMI